ncbi:unnamed protein product [Sphagnum tenellum]
MVSLGILGVVSFSSLFLMSFSGSRSPHHPKELVDTNSPVSESSVAKMTPREQQEMLELLSCTNATLQSASCSP